MTEEDLKLIFAQNIAWANAETFCTSHGLPVEIIEETENGYRICIEFKF